MKQIVSYIMFTALIALGCRGDDLPAVQEINVLGDICPFFSSDLITGSIQVGVVGRKNLVATSSSGGATVNCSANFQLDDVPASERVIFRLFGGSSSEIFVFPVTATNSGVQLASVSPTFKTNLETTATSQGLTLDPANSTVLGTVSSENRAQIVTVRLLEIDGAAVTGVNGVFFFEEDTTITSAIGNLRLCQPGAETFNCEEFPNMELNGKYVFFNVPEGVYEINFISASGIIFAQNISVPGAVLVTGRDIP